MAINQIIGIALMLAGLTLVQVRRGVVKTKIQIAEEAEFQSRTTVD